MIVSWDTYFNKVAVNADLTDVRAEKPNELIAGIHYTQDPVYS